MLDITTAEKLKSYNITDSSVEGLLDWLDLTVIAKQPTDPTPVLKGLTIHYSTINKNWEIYYGQHATTKYRITGDSIHEALAKTIVYQNQDLKELVV